MHQRQRVRVSSLSRIVVGTLTAIVLAFSLSTILSWHPFCVLYTPWDIEYYIFQCWDGPPHPPEG
jgi:hypothetical protein